MHNSKNEFLLYWYGLLSLVSSFPRLAEEIEQMRLELYALAYGSLIYAMVYTKQDIRYIVGIVKWYQSNLGLDNWSVVKNIIKYLKRINDIILIYGCDDMVLVRYASSDFQSEVDTMRFMT